MKPRIACSFSAAMTIFLALLWLAVDVGAQGTPPAIPHKLEQRERCLSCHDIGMDIAAVPQIPRSHNDYTEDMCRGCHSPAAPAQTGGAAPVPHTLVGRENCLQCHTSPEAAVLPGGPPGIPHTLVNRDDCLACHEQGGGGAPVIPADHAGRPSSICQTCHKANQPSESATAAELGPIPTPIAYPRPQGDNAQKDTCVECHRTLDAGHAATVVDWEVSVHAERDVTCVNCHGGDPTAATAEEAKSPAAGYLGIPAKKDIPALCASCHANVDLMRQYNLPTDQYAKYHESVHGIRLAEGDTNVTTCYDCHGGHKVLKANDPASTVYPANVPALCAGCHSDNDLMASYGIPVNQYELYRTSVHGTALVDNQDFRAPNCATCHGTHGAAPPGVQEVATVCGNCHSATQEHYLKGPHGSGISGPECVTCHGQHDVLQPTEAVFVGDDPRHCGSCHSNDSDPGRTAVFFYDQISGAAKAYEEAETSIAAARKLGMLVSPQEALMQEANTALVTARAAQHTLDSDAVYDKTAKATETAQRAKAEAEASVRESRFRRGAMVIAVAAIAVTILALYQLKRELDRRAEA